jgi:hypothetical protein
MPGSLRLDIGYRTPLPRISAITANVRYQFSLGRGLWGYRDLNLDEGKITQVGPENRPFFGSTSAITTRNGSVSMASSRLDPDYANVYEVSSRLQSRTHQFTAQLNGTWPSRLRTNLTYTLTHSRDQGSGTLQQVTTAGNPNEVEWAPATQDRRHNLNFTLTFPLTQYLELSANGRLQSGAPFTPLVNRDINGDGLRNDRPYVFDPRTTADTAVANGMWRLMETVTPRVRECLESQFGSIAGRNSCRQTWTQTLNLSVNFRPLLPRVQRRVTVTANFRNILTGMDYLLHGQGNMKGWGEGQRVDANLLEVRRFDRASNSFVYTVNEGFAQDSRGPEAFRNAFTVTLTARMQIGGNPQQASRGFITVPGQGGGRGGGAGGGGPTGFQLQQLTGMLRTRQGPGQNQAPDVDGIVRDLLANPVERILTLADTLKLTEEQVAAFEVLSDSLQLQMDERKEPLTAAIAALAPEILAPDASSLFGPQSDVQRSFIADVQPHVNGARQQVAARLRRVQQQLSAEQWALVPQDVRGLVQQQGGGGRGGSQGFNAVSTLDRMLANPLLVLLDLEDILAFTPEQLAGIQAASASLQQKLAERRASLGGRFDGVPSAEQAQIFQQIQPEIEVGREDIRSALRNVEGLLTPEQWAQVPTAVKDPFTQPQRGQGGARPPGY